jgi:hypothetical protein
MSVILKANIEEDKNNWIIHITDTSDNTEVICDSLEDFSIKIEEMGSEYGNDVEVVWSKNPDVTDEHFKEIHTQMAKYKEEEKKEDN